MMKFDVGEYLDQIRDTYAKECGERLAKHIRSPRFPFTYHHDEVREWVGPNVSRASVAVALEERFGREKEYIDEACSGAFAHIVTEYAEDMLDDIRDICEELDDDNMNVYGCILAHAAKFDRNAWIDYFSRKAVE